MMNSGAITLPTPTNTQNQSSENLILDKLWRMNNLYFIQTKDKQLLPMSLNKAQTHYLTHRKNRNYILKARQLGFSTYGLIDLLDETIYHKNTVSAIVAHEKQKVVQLFEIVKRAYDNLPNDPRVKPRVSIENRNELYFPDLDSKIYVTMDTRGATVHNLHVSELAFIAHADQRLAATLESVPIDGMISFETTANGMSNYAFEEWSDSHSEYAHFFYSWLWDDKYRLPTDRLMGDLKQEYRDLAIKYGLLEDAVDRYSLDEEQLAFYISKIKRHKKLVLQEYPFNDQEAFISSGLGVFNPVDLAKHEAINPIERKWSDCLIWEHPVDGFRYSMGVDSSEGLGGDNAVIEVLNSSTGEQVAEFATPNIPPDVLASYVIEIGKYYNNALVVPEINSSGITLVDHIKTKYFNIYRREVFDKRSRERREALGWRTTPVTKPLLVEQLEEAIREEYISVNSIEALKELRTFVRTAESGKKGFGAEGVNHDDRVIALGLAYQGIQWQPRMKKPVSIAQQKLTEYIEKKRLSQHFPEDKVTQMIRDQRMKRYGNSGIRRN